MEYLVGFVYALTGFGLGAGWRYWNGFFKMLFVFMFPLHALLAWVVKASRHARNRAWGKLWERRKFFE